MDNVRKLMELGMTPQLAKAVADMIATQAAADVTVATFTTAGSTEISGTLQEVLEEIADLADPAG